MSTKPRFSPGASRRLAAPAVAFILAASTAAVGEVIYSTDDPFGGPFGPIGFDICPTQSVAVRFTPEDDYTLDRVSVWFMSNDFSDRTNPEVWVNVHTDGDDAGNVNVPGDGVLESWSFNVSAVGWQPILEPQTSKLNPMLRAGQNYWVVCASQAPCGLDGVWSWAATGTGMVSICNGNPCEWISGTGAVPGLIVEATPIIDGDLDVDGDVDGADLGGLLLDWGPCPRGHLCLADLSGDGEVDGADLGTLLLNWTP